MAPFAVLAYQMGPPKESQVLRDGRTGYGEGAGDLSGGLAAAAKQIKDGAAGRVGEGLEGGLRIPRRRIRN